jgi:hypothetical protein
MSESIYFGKNVDGRILYGPVSLGIYSDKTNCVMLIGDRHDISTEKETKSLMEFFSFLQQDQKIAFLAEGSHKKYNEETIKTEKRKRNLLDDSQLYVTKNKQFDMIWVDNRETTFIFGVLRSLIKFINSKEGDINYFYDYFKRIQKFTLMHFVKEYKLTDILRSLKKHNKKIILDIIKTHQHLITKLKEHMGIFIDIIDNKEKYSLVEPKLKLQLSYVMKYLFNWGSACLEIYCIAIILQERYSKYILHLGDFHIQNIKKILMNSLGYKKIHEATNIDERTLRF